MAAESTAEHEGSQTPMTLLIQLSFTLAQHMCQGHTRHRSLKIWDSINTEHRGSTELKRGTSYAGMPQLSSSLPTSCAQEYLYRKSLEGKERATYERKRILKKALEGGAAQPGARSSRALPVCSWVLFTLFYFFTTQMASPFPMS